MKVMMKVSTKLLIGLCVTVVAVLVLTRASRGHSSDVLNRVRANFILIHPKYGGITLQEGDSSYTENKRVISLCTVNPNTGEHYDMNTIMYVALHELAHVVTPKYDKNGNLHDEHSAAFKKNFALLLKRATKLRIYNPSIPIPSTYCGIKDNF